MRHLILFTLLTISIGLHSQDWNTDSLDALLDEITVTSRGPSRFKSVGVINTEVISAGELLRAACCNLGESFTTNPSVDVNYSDAATGARHVRLLGLGGAYVQLLTENVPGFRMAAAPFALGYVPGPWMDGISVSKGSASVKNGYESITGQINIGLRKPQNDENLHLNVYAASDLRLEANIDGNLHISDRWSTGILAHYEDQIMGHDGNDDGFLDRPLTRQVNIMNRWAYFSDNIIFQSGIKGLGEWRRGGQSAHHYHSPLPRYRIDITTGRYEAFAKQAWIFNREHNSNVALILNAALHNLDSRFGMRRYDSRGWTGFASLMFETSFNEFHSLSAGLSFNHDDNRQHYLIDTADDRFIDNNFSESVAGAYAEYTLNIDQKLSILAGIRADYSSLWNWFLTPRAHIKWTPVEPFALRISAGRGSRTALPLAQHFSLLASSRSVHLDRNYFQEVAWNYGASASLNLPLWNDRLLTFAAEYYFTHFSRQMVVDMDSDPHALTFSQLDNRRSFSHTVQLEASYPLIEGLMLTAAWRWNDVRTEFIPGRLMSAPLVSRYKGLLTATYKTPLELWQFDLTLQLNGPGRLPENYITADGNPSWPANFSAYPQLSAQVTRFFRHFSVYIGGENLTAFKQRNPIISPDNPWSDTFDATMVWGPIEGAMAYIGFRYNLR